MAAKDRIELRITGSELNQSVRVKDFVSKLSQFIELLMEYDRAYSGGAIDYYKIGGLSYNSPPLAVPEAVAKQGQDYKIQGIHESLIRDLESIPSGTVSEAFTHDVLNKLNALCKTAKGRVKSVEIAYGGHSVHVGPALIQQIEDILGGITYAYGEVVGSLDNFMFHDEDNPYFVVFPQVGAHSIRCYFNDPGLEDELVRYKKKLVSVRGVLVYRERNDFPVRVEVQGIELLEGEPVSLLEMFRGEPITAPRSIREGRDAWDEA